MDGILLHACERLDYYLNETRLDYYLNETRLDYYFD